MVYTNNSSPTPVDTVTLEQFAAERGIGVKSAKRLLARAKVPIIQLSGTSVINFASAAKLIQEYYVSEP